MGNLFVPVLLIIAGVLMLLKAVMHIDIPVFKILLAVALVWGGISLIGGTTVRRAAAAWK